MSRFVGPCLAGTIALAVNNCYTELVRADEFLICDLPNACVHRVDALTGDSLGYFIRPGAGGIAKPHSMAFGPDGNLYLANWGTDNVTRHDGTTGAYLGEFISAGTGGLSRPTEIIFGADGLLYMASFSNDNVLRFDATTGAFVDEFVVSGSGGLDRPELMAFGPDLNLYSTSLETHNILRFDQSTGTFLDEFVPSRTGGLDRCHAILFAPDGLLYASCFNRNTILRFDALTGAFLDEFVSGDESIGEGGLYHPHGMLCDADGSLLVCSFGTGKILRFDSLNGDFLGEFTGPGPTKMDGPTMILRVSDRSPRLQPISPARAGENNTISVTGLNPGEPVDFYYGFSDGQTAWTPCPGVFISVSNARYLASETADGSGTCTIERFVTSRAAGRTIVVQALRPSDCTLTNVRFETLQ